MKIEIKLLTKKSQFSLCWVFPTQLYTWGCCIKRISENAWCPSPLARFISPGRLALTASPASQENLRGAKLQKKTGCFVDFCSQFNHENLRAPPIANRPGNTALLGILEGQGMIVVSYPLNKALFLGGWHPGTTNFPWNHAKLCCWLAVA